MFSPPTPRRASHKSSAGTKLDSAADTDAPDPNVGTASPPPRDADTPFGVDSPPSSPPPPPVAIGPDGIKHTGPTGAVPIGLRQWKPPEFLLVTLAATYLYFLHAKGGSALEKGDSPEAIPPLGMALLKASPVLMLLYFISDHKETNRIGLFAALFFSAAGDIALSFEDYPEPYAEERLKAIGPNWSMFDVGAVSFAIAHVCYIVELAQKPKFSPMLGTLASVLIMAFTKVQIELRVAAKESGHLDDVPMVIQYSYVLMAMCLCALFGSTHGWEALVGALVFVFSDICVALKRFGGDSSSSKFLSGFQGSAVIMISYYTAQALLTTGLLKR